MGRQGSLGFIHKNDYCLFIALELISCPIFIPGLLESEEGSAERRDLLPVGDQVLHGVQQDLQVQS